MKTAAIFAVFLSVIVSAPAQQEAEKKKAPHPSLAKIEEAPGLPRVLLIGDSISMGYTVPVRELLKGKANLCRIPMNGGPTSRGIENIDKWLGEGKWDVIHFNWGIHDTKVMPGGEHQVELDAYEANLRTLVAKMQATGAKLIWASTTPIPHGEMGPDRKFGDETEYNRIAAKVMKEAGVKTDDLYTYMLPEVKRLQKPGDLHYLPEGSDYLAVKVAEEIEKVLKE